MASILDQTTSRDEFITTVFKKSESENSRKMAKNAFKKWDAFLTKYYANQSEPDIILELKRISQEPEFYQFLNRFVQFMVNDGLSKNGVVSYFNQIKAWLRFNAIRIHNDDIKQFVNFPKQIKEIRRPLTMEMINDLMKYVHNDRLKALVFTLVSSGMRINEALQLRYQDITGNQVRLRASTTKTRTERMVFISKEAIDAINFIRKDKKDHDYIFVDSWSHSSICTYETIFRIARNRAGFNSKYDNGKMYTFNIHAFRAYFKTQATRVLGDGIAHALIGHGAYLSQYDRFTPEEQKELYAKLEPHVTVSNETRLRGKLDKTEQQLQKQNEMALELQKQKDKILRLEQMLANR